MVTYSEDPEIRLNLEARRFYGYNVMAANGKHILNPLRRQEIDERRPLHPLVCYLRHARA